MSGHIPGGEVGDAAAEWIHARYPLQFLLLVPFVRLGERLVGAAPVALSPTALIEGFHQSFSGFVAQFGWAFVHGMLGWALTVPFAASFLHLLLRAAFRRFAPRPAATWRGSER